MFDESNLHSLITRESEQRNIPLRKLIRVSLNAAADGRFAVRSETPLSPSYREELRRLAATAEAQRDWHWWHKPPFSDLKLLLAPEADYLAWLDQELRPTNEAAPIASESEPKLKPAPESKIDQVIKAEYDEAQQRGQKPPNLKEFAEPVQANLHDEPTSEALSKERKSQPKPASGPKIDQTITAVYDEAKQKGTKPPNIKEIVEPVQAKLHAEGYSASGRQIQKLAEGEKHKNCRRPPGRTVATDKPPDRR